MRSEPHSVSSRLSPSASGNPLRGPVFALTWDYELFGDGSGSLRRHVFEPTRRFLTLCDRLSVHATLFVDVAELWAFEEHRTQLAARLQADLDSVKSQLVDAVRRGHEVQLHIHPQWFGARYDGKRWHLVLENWRLPDYAERLGSPERLAAILRRGAETIRDIYARAGRSAPRLAFRAGGLNMYPSRAILPALLAAGITIDSSTYPGAVADSPYFSVDYSDISETEGYWFATEDVVHDRLPRSGPRTILELPLFAAPVPFLLRNTVSRLVAKVLYRARRLLLRRRPLRNVPRRTAAGALSPTRSLPRSIPWDFCNLSRRGNLFMIRRARQILQEFGPRPFVLIGHSKEFTSPSLLRRMVKDVRQEIPGARFLPLATLADELW